MLSAFLLIGIVAGWIAARSMGGDGLGLPASLGVGIAGALAGGFLFGLAPMSLENGLIGAPIAAAGGAVLALYLARRIRRR